MNSCSEGRQKEEKIHCIVQKHKNQEKNLMINLWIEKDLVLINPFRNIFLNDSFLIFMLNKVTKQLYAIQESVNYQNKNNSCNNPLKLHYVHMLKLLIFYGLLDSKSWTNFLMWDSARSFPFLKKLLKPNMTHSCKN